MELTDICGEEYLVYKIPKLDIALVRGTTSDELGNITIEEESAPVDLLDVVMGVKAWAAKSSFKSRIMSLPAPWTAPKLLYRAAW